MSEQKAKILRMDQAVILGASCLLAGFLLGLLSYHLIGGSAPAQVPVVQQQMDAPPPVASAPGQNMPDLSAQIREVKAILERDPGNRNAWVNLGNLAFDSGRSQESVDAYTKALAINGNDANVLTDRGIMYRALGNFSAALKDFDKAAQVDPTHIQSLYNKGITMLHDLNDAKGALAAWEDLLKRNPPPELTAQMKERITSLRELIAKNPGGVKMGQP